MSVGSFEVPCVCRVRSWLWAPRIAHGYMVIFSVSGSCLRIIPAFLTRRSSEVHEWDSRRAANLLASLEGWKVQSRNYENKHDDEHVTLVVPWHAKQSRSQYFRHISVRLKGTTAIILFWCACICQANAITHLRRTRWFFFFFSNFFLKGVIPFFVPRLPVRTRPWLILEGCPAHSYPFRQLSIHTLYSPQETITLPISSFIPLQTTFSSIFIEIISPNERATSSITCSFLTFPIQQLHFFNKLETNITLVV